jgi:hypothetical protein
LRVVPLGEGYVDHVANVVMVCAVVVRKVGGEVGSVQEKSK